MVHLPKTSSAFPHAQQQSHTQGNSTTALLPAAEAAPPSSTGSALQWVRAPLTSCQAGVEGQGRAHEC